MKADALIVSKSNQRRLSHCCLLTLRLYCTSHVFSLKQYIAHEHSPEIIDHWSKKWGFHFENVTSKTDERQKQSNSYQINRFCHDIGTNGDTRSSLIVKMTIDTKYNTVLLQIFNVNPGTFIHSIYTSNIARYLKSSFFYQQPPCLKTALFFIIFEDRSPALFVQKECSSIELYSNLLTAESCRKVASLKVVKTPVCIHSLNGAALHNLWLPLHTGEVWHSRACYGNLCKSLTCATVT